MRLIFLLLTCVTALALPGSVRETKSKLDGERQVIIEPGWLRSDSLMKSEAKLGGFWTDKAPDRFFLDLVVVGSGDIKGAKLGIDGEIIELTPADSHTEFAFNYTLPESTRRFTVPLSLIEKMVAAKSVIVQADCGRSKVETEFSNDAPTHARRAFRKALSKIAASKK